MARVKHLNPSTFEKFSLLTISNPFSVLISDFLKISLIFFAMSTEALPIHIRKSFVLS